MKAPILNDEQFNTVLDFTQTMERPAMYRLMLLLSIRLGLRPLELAGMDSNWFSTGELRIPLGYSKRGEGRSLPINSEIACAFADHMQGREGAVFVNAQGQRFSPQGISDAMRRLYREAGVKGSCYSGRRSLATRLVDEGANILVVQAVLGHKNASTTAEYVGVTNNMLKRALFS